MATYASVFIVWPNPREIIEYEHDVHGDIVFDADGKKKVLSSTPSFLASLSDQEVCDTVLNMWVNSKPGRIGAVTYCISCNGFHHLHMVLEVENSDSDRFTFKQVQKLFDKRFHIEPTRGNKKEAEDYIYKRGKYAEKDEVVTAVAQIGSIKGNQGQRSDLKQMDEMLRSGMTPKQILDELGLSAYRYESMLTKAYVRKREKETPTYRQVVTYWHVGKSFSGKSYSMMELEEKLGKENVYKVVDYRKGPFDKYDYQPVLFLDEFKPYSLPYGTLLAILNNYSLDIGCRYKDNCMAWNEVHITTIYPPEEMYKKMVDRCDREYDTYDQLANRIDYVVYHWKDGNEYKVYQVPMSEYSTYDMLKYRATSGKTLKDGFMTVSPEEEKRITELFGL